MKLQLSFVLLGVMNLITSFCQAQQTTDSAHFLTNSQLVLAEGDTSQLVVFCIGLDHSRKFNKLNHEISSDFMSSNSISSLFIEGQAPISLIIDSKKYQDGPAEVYPIDIVINMKRGLSYLRTFVKYNVASEQWHTNTLFIHEFLDSIKQYNVEEQLGALCEFVNLNSAQIISADRSIYFAIKSLCTSYEELGQTKLSEKELIRSDSLLELRERVITTNFMDATKLIGSRTATLTIGAYHVLKTYDDSDMLFHPFTTQIDTNLNQKLKLVSIPLLYLKLSKIGDELEIKEHRDYMACFNIDIDLSNLPAKTGVYYLPLNSECADYLGVVIY